MVLTKKFKAFDDSIFELHPDLKDVLKPNSNNILITAPSIAMVLIVDISYNQSSNHENDL